LAAGRAGPLTKTMLKFLPCSVGANPLAGQSKRRLMETDFERIASFLEQPDVWEKFIDDCCNGNNAWAESLTDKLRNLKETK
jgi:hypothetical protein